MVTRETRRETRPQEQMGRASRLRFLLVVLAAAAVLAACAASGHAQSSPTSSAPGSIRGFPQDSGPFETGGVDDVGSLDAERRMNALNAERQKSLTSDTARLLKLAAELNQQIAKSNPGQLTAEQLRMVAEIEKLAHNVREKMAMSLRSPQLPSIDTPMQPFPPSSHP
jgi:hypothetical protein